MDNQKAKFILQSWRPGGADAGDPHFHEALAQTGRAPDLAEWFAREQALDVAKGDALRRFVTEIAVIGGAEIYAQWMGQADRLEITEVHATPAGDTRFGPIDKTVWDEAARTENPAGPDDSVAFSYVTYIRRRPH